MRLKVNQVPKLRGEVKVPGDKSISHRALMIGALAEGQTELRGFLDAADCLHTLKAFQDLGVNIVRLGRMAETSLLVKGRGLKGFKEPKKVLDLGNSGTTLRLLSGILAGQDFLTILTGDESLRTRPMDRVIIPLSQMGAQIWAREGKFAPLTIQGRPLKGITYVTPIPSAQLKSALILAGLLAGGKTKVIEEVVSRDHTERMLKHFGAEIETQDTSVTVTGEKSFQGSNLDIPGDLSSALFLIVGALLIPQAEILIREVGVNPTRTYALKVLKEMGAFIEEINLREKNNEPRADILIKSSKLKAVTIKGEAIPKLIDELPVLAVAATQAEGKTYVKEAQELRVKESDRARTIVEGLKKLGAKAKELEDGFMVEGPTNLKGSLCQSYGDHRIAMALAIAGLKAEGETTIEGAECIKVSFPGFEETLKSLIT